MEAHQLRIAITLILRQARNVLGIKVAGDDFEGMGYTEAQMMYNPIAKANILEGAHGWRKDSLLRGSQEARQVARALAKMGPDKDVHPSLLDFSRQAMVEGPVTKYTLAKIDPMVKAANRSGIAYDMLIGGLWNSAMLPGVGGDGLMDTSTEDFWWKLGKTHARQIKSGDYTLKMMSGATNKKLMDLAKNLLQAGALQEADQGVEGVGIEEWSGQSGSEVSEENIVTLLFSAISNPGKWHNRAKEWFAEHIGSRLSGTMLEVFEAYQYLGATPKGGIQGGYGDAAEFVNNKREERGEAPISPKGVKKAWEKIKERFPDAFDTGLHDRKYNDMMQGLLDDADIGADFGGRGYAQPARRETYDESRRDMGRRASSIINRHAYRQQLRLRKLASASTKTAAVFTFTKHTDVERWENGRKDPKGDFFKKGEGIKGKLIKEVRGQLHVETPQKEIYIFPKANVKKASTKTAAPDYEWWEKNGRSFKSKITRAERVLRKDPAKALKAADELFVIMDRRGYPDNSSRVQRLKDDAEHEIRMQSDGW